MLLDTDFRVLGEVPQSVRAGLADLAVRTDWQKKEFTSADPYYYSRVVYVPYGIRRELPQEHTQDVRNILQQFEPIDRWMHEKFPDHVFVKGEIACLLPGQEVIWHVDGSWWHQYSHRVHVPIVSNPSCFWCVEDREHYFDVGCYYEVNNRRYHSYCNRGDSIRLHLVFDVLPNATYQNALDQGIDISMVTKRTLGLNRQQFFERLPELLQEEYY